MTATATGGHRVHSLSVSFFLPLPLPLPCHLISFHSDFFGQTVELNKREREIARKGD